MKAHYDAAGTNLAIPPAPDTSSKWNARVTESSEEIDKIMREKPWGQRRVD